MDIDINLVNYEFNLINDNWLCEMLFVVKCGGFEFFVECVDGEKICQCSFLFGEYYVQLCLFWLSQMLIEQQYIIDGFSFEFSKVVCIWICEWVVDYLVYIDIKFVEVVGVNLGIELSDDQCNIILFVLVNGVEKDFSFSFYVDVEGDVKGCVVVVLFNECILVQDLVQFLQVLQVQGVYSKLFYL